MFKLKRRRLRSGGFLAKPLMGPGQATVDGGAIGFGAKLGYERSAGLFGGHGGSEMPWSCRETVGGLCGTKVCRRHWCMGEACSLSIDSAGERPVGTGLALFLACAVGLRRFHAGSLSNRGNVSSFLVEGAGSSGAPRASRPPGRLAWRNRRLNSRSNLPVFHWPYRQVQSLCKRNRVWQSIYFRSSGGSRFISKLRMNQCQASRIAQNRQSDRMSLSPRGIYGMILVVRRAVFNHRLDNLAAGWLPVRLTRPGSADVRAISEIQRYGRTARGGLSYWLTNQTNLMVNRGVLGCRIN